MGRLKHNSLQIFMHAFRVCCHWNAISQLHFGATVRRRSFLNHCTLYRDSHESAASRHGACDCQWDFRTRVCACASMTYDSMRLKPRCLPVVDNGDMLKQSVCQQCIITLVSCSIVSGAVNYFWGYVWALVLFTAVDFLVVYEEKARLILYDYDWKIPQFRSNILFLMRLFVEQ